MDRVLKKQITEMVERGSKPEAVVELLHASGSSVIESIKAVMEFYAMTLANAKQLVASQPCWKQVTAEADKLHEEILDELQKRKN